MIKLLLICWPWYLMCFQWSATGREMGTTVKQVWNLFCTFIFILFIIYLVLFILCHHQLTMSSNCCENSIFIIILILTCIITLWILSSLVCESQILHPQLLQNPTRNENAHNHINVYTWLDFLTISCWLGWS